MSETRPATTVTYNFTLEDMQQKLPPKSAAAAPTRKTGHIVWVFLGTILLWGIYLAILPIFEPVRPPGTPPPPPSTTWPVTTGLVLLTIFGFWLYIRGYLKRYYAKLASMHALGPLPLKVTITFEDDGFRVNSVIGNSLVYWRNLYAIVDSEKYIFLAITMLQVYPVPRSAFSSPAQADSFRFEANRRMREAGGGRTVPDEPISART